jgi:hemerythrin-like domain-containing protein
MADRMTHTFDELVEKQRAADQAHNRVEELRHSYGPPTEHKWTRQQTTTYETALRAWRDLDRDARAALTEYAKERGRSRREVQAEVETAVRRRDLD